ncbi:MAG: class I SAM-dependent methyltransferase, partial [Acidimicrobiales bacterium]
SFRGRSTIVLALGTGPDVDLVAIDPHGGGDRGPGEIAPDAARGAADLAAFRANLAAAGVTGRVRHVRRESRDAHREVSGEIDLLYIDGAHRYGPARADVVGWGSRVSGGGVMLVHDAFSSVGVTLALLTTVARGRDFRYIGRTGSMAQYRRERLGRRDRLVNAVRHLLLLPWFARNLTVKALLVMRLRPLARLLGHTTGDWPY